MAITPVIPVDDTTTLRRWTPDDVHALYDAVMADQEHVARWLTWAAGYTLEGADSFIANCLSEYPSGGLAFAVDVSGRLVGGIDVPRSTPEHREYEIGYWLSKPYTGRGIMTRSAEALTDFLFREREAHRVQIAALEGNTASRAVAERLGFTLEGLFRESRWNRGEWHSMAWYAITEDEWRSRRRPLA
ncbi:MAG: GNAT family protein [Chloroflexi bacterium]|nr:GNAT family protein [Chloroflexota bacterium]